jgi:pyruvate/2-oxoacid:ferredoxin oxidoreductase beta subunit/Pyruvate/2-oxoacid:ferredoxin oxidoreductase delta subunit
VIVAETETAFNPLESNTQEFPEVIGIKLPGAPMETHEATFAESHLIELDLEKYVDDFNGRVIGAYQEGKASAELPADLGVARSLIPAGTGALRDFSYIAPEIPRFDLEKCVGCMSCVTLCPDTAILGKAIPASKVEAALENIKDSSERAWVGSHWARTRKYFDLPQKKGNEGALFGIFIDPTKCKGCAECVQVCDELDYHALEMVKKDETTLPRYRWAFDVFRKIGPTPPEYINERALADFMLAEERSLLYVGGAGSCMGCGEATAIRMMLAATGFVHGPENIGIVASTGCNTVYGSTYPYNPYVVPWTNSLFENAPADAMGIRARWDQRGWKDKALWVIGGDGAMYDIGFQSLSRMLASGMNIKVMVLDTQVYSNTGGQASTATFGAQEAKMAAFGKFAAGKCERRKELAQICLMHPEVYVAQTTAAHINHFYKAVMEANEYLGPAVINVYTTCQPEHGVPDCNSTHQAKRAVESRAFPIFTFDPRRGKKIRERLSLVGNPAHKDDWWAPPNCEKPLTFIDFARTEGRFAKQFDSEGNPSGVLLQTEEERLQNWRLLQELAGLR